MDGENKVFSEKKELAFFYSYIVWAVHKGKILLFYSFILWAVLKENNSLFFSGLFLKESTCSFTPLSY